jgi:hypothetical protein
MPDLAHLPSGWLYQRFVGWARETPYPSAVEILAHSFEQVQAHTSNGAGWPGVGPAARSAGRACPRSGP